MKKFLSLVLAIFMVLSMSFLLICCTSNENQNADLNANDIANDTEATESETEGNVLGDYTLEIKGYRFVDYFDESALVVKYSFTNNSNKPSSFAQSFKINVYQNGVGLEEAWGVTDENYSFGDRYKEIKPGASFELEVAYTLDDATTDVEVEACQIYGSFDKKITKTFTIAS